MTAIASTMSNTAVILVLCLCFFTASIATNLVDDLPADSDIRLKTRDLLQESDYNDDDDDVEIREMKGPEEFFDPGKFYLQVKGGIEVWLYDAKNMSRRLSTYRLNRPARSLAGSFVDEKRRRFMESLVWKTDFAADSGDGNLRLDGIVVKMTFVRDRQEFTLAGLSAEGVEVNGDYLKDIKLKPVTSKGYTVSAPLGLSFCCDAAGLFKPDMSHEDNRNRADNYLVALKFPNMRLQVFDIKEPKPGNRWYCGTFMSVGLWVGVIMTLFFALVVYWGISMLASIKTMDRFDDPKGKPINVPANE